MSARPLFLGVIGSLFLVTPAFADVPTQDFDNEAFYARRPDVTGSQGAGPSLFTGAAEMSIPIEVPRAAAGMSPSLSLSYNSRKWRSNAGFGWSLDLPRITRSTKYGNDLARTWSPSNAKYAFGSRELVRSASTMTDPYGCTAVRYFSESDSAQRILFCEANNYWTVTSKDGTSRAFGRVATFRGTAPPQRSSGTSTKSSTSTRSAGRPNTSR